MGQIHNHETRRNKFNAEKFIDGVIAFTLKHEASIAITCYMAFFVFLITLFVLTYKDAKEHPDIDYSYEYNDVAEFINGYDIANIEVSYNDDNERIVKITRLVDGSEESKEFHSDVFEFSFLLSNIISNRDSPDSNYHVIESMRGKKKYFSLYYPTGFYSDRNKAVIKSN